ncbi:unnamed protein product [Sphagnum troendelagicum]|uniref:Uncharacterized protein n=1 Tax=Sphagnum troendelagicum TaxID=128251 RepID=A0ABP0TRL4_9BRYO
MTAGGAAAAAHVARAGANLPIGVNNSQPIPGFLPVDLGWSHQKKRPKLLTLVWGFTENAEVSNSWAAMIGLLGITVVEAASTLISSLGLLEFCNLLGYRNTSNAVNILST